MSQPLSLILLHRLLHQNRQPFLMGKFAWQAGYRAFSIGFSQITGQEVHHRKVSFQDEFRKFLKRYEVEYDERYVWD